MEKKQLDNPKEIIFFEDSTAFRNWLELNFDKKKELFVGYYKLNSGKKSMNWSDSVDQALCFGWIDGVKYRIDDQSYKIRFTPRQKSSIWSAVNIEKIAKLSKVNLMHPAGIEAFQRRKDEKSKIYAFEQNEVILKSSYKIIFEQQIDAWSFFAKWAPSYQKTAIHWIMSAKLEKTQLKRLNQLIEECLENKNRWKSNK